jgi:protein phosphatase
MLVAIWPRVYVVHVGDSRAYRLRDGTLEQLTTDQTMAQAMIDSGEWTRAIADASPLKHVLVSALGSQQVDPQIRSLDLERQDVVLLCTDGLTKHVSDDEIRDRLTRGDSSAAMCHSLIDLALSRGGADNVTVVIGKAPLS